MLFMIFCYDKPDHVHVRLATRAAHLDYLKAAEKKVKLAGPVFSDDTGDKPVGSIILLDADSEKAARLFTRDDPYTQAKLFERVEIYPWTAALGEWMRASRILS